MTRLELALALCQRLSDDAEKKGNKSLVKRLGQAGVLLVDDKVTDLGGGYFLVGSQSTPDKTYAVRPGECSCAANYYGIKCTHRIAAYLWQEAGRLEENQNELARLQGDDLSPLPGSQDWRRPGDLYERRQTTKPAKTGGEN